MAAASHENQSASTRRLAPRDYQALAQFRYQLTQFSTLSEQAARQQRALLAIKGHPGAGEMTIGHRAQRLGIRPHCSGELVTRLVSRGYLPRRKDSHDRRRILLCVTVVGEKALSGRSEARRRELRRLAPLLRALLGRLGPPEKRGGK